MELLLRRLNESVLEMESARATESRTARTESDICTVSCAISVLCGFLCLFLLDLRSFCEETEKELMTSNNSTIDISLSYPILLLPCLY